VLQPSGFTAGSLPIESLTFASIVPEPIKTISDSGNPALDCGEPRFDLIVEATPRSSIHRVGQLFCLREGIDDAIARAFNVISESILWTNSKP
jgi:hypothetical protein